MYISDCKNRHILSIFQTFMGKSADLMFLPRHFPGFLPTGEELVHQRIETGIVAGFKQMAQFMNYHMLDTPFRQQQQIGRETDRLILDITDAPT